MEDKKEFVEAFEHVIKLTRAGSDVESLVYSSEANSETVTISFANGGKKIVDVTADSKLAIILDVARALG